MKNLKRFDVPASYEADIPKQEYQVSLIENPESVKFDTNIGPPVPKTHTITFPQEFFDSPNIDVELMIDYVSTTIESNVIEVETGKYIFFNIITSDTGKGLYRFTELKCTPAITSFATAEDGAGCTIPGWNIDQDIVISGTLVEIPKKYTITLPQELVNNLNTNIFISPKGAGVLDGNIINCNSLSPISVDISLNGLDYMISNAKCNPKIAEFYDEKGSNGTSIAILGWKPNQNLVITADIVKQPKKYTFDIASRLKPVVDVLDKSGNKIDVNTLPISITEGTEVAYKIVPKDINKYKFTSAVVTKLSKDSYYKCSESAIEILPHAMEKNISVDANIDLYYKLTYKFNYPSADFTEQSVVINQLMVNDENDNNLVDEIDIPVPVINDTTGEYSLYVRPKWAFMIQATHDSGSGGTWISTKNGVQLIPDDGIIYDYSVDGYQYKIEFIAKSLVKDTVVNFNFTNDIYSRVTEVVYDYDKFFAAPNLPEENPWVSVTPNADQVLIAKS